MAAPPLEFLWNYLWIFVSFASTGISITAFLLYHFWYQPPIARDMTKAKHSRKPCAFIENDEGIVEFIFADKQMPEGVVRTKRGWFLLPRRSFKSEIPSEVSESKSNKPLTDKQKAVLAKKKQAKEAEEYGELVLHVPTLRGLGKQVFFGSSTAAGLAGLKAIAHADLRKVRELAPSMFQKTQLDALATGSRLEGLKMAGRESGKILIYAIAGAIIIVAIVAGVYLLTSRPSAQMAGNVLAYLRLV